MGDLDWERLGEYARIRRAQLGLTQDEVTERGGPSDTLQNRIEAGRWRPVRAVSGTFTKLEAGLGWARGSVTSVLAGGEPRDALNCNPSESNGTESDDAEFLAMRQVSAVLSGLSPEAQVRVLQWASAKYSAAEST